MDWKNLTMKINYHHLAIFLLLLTSARFLSADEPCSLKDNDLTVVCEPCEKETWLDMVLPSSGSEVSTNAEKTCFNNDPILVDQADPSIVKPDDSSLMGSDAYRARTSVGPKGFLIRKEPFFRYAHLTVEPPTPTPIEKLDKYLDVNEVKKYYVKRAKDASQELLEVADIQLIEWPGLTTEQTFAQINSDRHKSNKSWMLHVERDSGKIIHYPCNKEDGSSIVAVTSVKIESENNTSNTTNGTDKKDEPEYGSKQQLWLAHGRYSIFNNYMPPLHVPLNVLAKMVHEKENTTSNISCTIDNDIPSMDLRTVLDFSFSEDRLILGMKCGIIVVGKLHSDNLTYTASTRIHPNGTDTFFPEPVNLVSSYTCCMSEVLCGTMGSIVGAYSFDADRNATANKFIYISFDAGATFETKIIATSLSPINLIKGMFKLYEEWRDYFEILDDPPHQYDVDHDDSQMTKLRAKEEWKSATVAKKEELFSIGTAAKGKRNASTRKIVEILETRVPARRNHFGRRNDSAPDWVNEVIDRERAKHNWTAGWETTCDQVSECQERFEDDIAVSYLLKDSGIKVKTPKRNENEPFCRDIVSILFVPEEQQLLCLCLIGYAKLSDPLKDPHKDPGEYAFYNFPIKFSLPLIYGYRVSHRILVCPHLKVEDKNTTRIVYPQIVRVQNGATIVIINCARTVYLSNDLGTTLFNAAFYYEYEMVEKYCKLVPNFQPPDATKNPRVCPHEPHRKETATTTYIRSYELCALDVPPLITIDSTGFFLVLTFGRFYAKGAITFDKETRLVVGEVLREFDNNTNEGFENLAFPSLDIHGDAIVAVSLTQLYSVVDEDKNMFRNVLYKNRLALRLVPIPLPYYQDSRNYHDGNLGMCEVAKDKRYGFPVCTTSSSAVYPQHISLDIGEKHYIQVTVVDENPFLPLWIFTSSEKSLDVNVFMSWREGSPLPHINLHNWKIDVTAKASAKDDYLKEPLVDAFFGSDYNNLNELSTQISFVNRPNVRCHVRTSSTVNIQIGCKGKRLVAFEESHRPQCKDFKKEFFYKIEAEKYDPELVNVWKMWSNKQSLNYFKTNDDGSLRIKYDYANWGCPIEPFKDDKFLPDLWIVEHVEENNTVVTRPFKGEFILIEIFGNKQFKYDKKVKDAGCKRRPQFLETMTEQWKLRQQLFELAATRLVYPRTLQELEALTDFNEIYGNAILNNTEIHNHINIWNQANYRSCHKGDPEDFSDVMSEEYNILKLPAGHNPNQITWDKNGLRVNVFFAVGVDFEESVCAFQTLFSVSIKKNYELDIWLILLLFLLFCLLWAALVIVGYYVRRHYLIVEYTNSAKQERLIQAAWSIIYRYEKLIHGEAMHTLFQSSVSQATMGGVTLKQKSAQEKKRTELAIKRNHVLATEEARHERLQKLFQKQTQ